MKDMSSMQKRLSQVCLILLIGLVPLVFLPGAQEDAFYIIKLYAGAAAVAMWVLGLVVLRGFDASRIRRYGPDAARLSYWEPGWLDALPLLLVFCVLISYAFSIDPSQSLLGFSWLPEGVFSWLLYMMVFLLSRHEGSWSDRWVTLILGAASLVALLGMLQFMGWIPLFGGGRLSQGMATIGNRNFVGTYATLMFPLAVWMWMERGKWPFLAASSLLFLLMLASLTRSAWVAFVIWFPLLLVLELREKIRVIRLLVFFGLVVAAFVMMDFATNHMFANRIFLLLRDAQNLTSDDAGSRRMLIWKMSVPLLFDRPLTGYGVDVFDLVFYTLESSRVYFGRLDTLMKAHNELLQIGITMGLPALATYLVLIIGSLAKGIRGLRDQLRPQGWKVAVLCSVIGYLVQAQFNISITVNAVIFWALLGLLASDVRMGKTENIE